MSTRTGRRAAFFHLAVVASAGAACIVVGLSGSQTRTVSAAPLVSVECSPPSSGSQQPERRLAAFDAIEPRRLVDTRDGTGGVGGPVGAGCALRLDVEAAGLDADADAFSFSVTAIGDRGGYQQIYPCDSGRPATSNVNNRPGGVPTPNLVVAQPDDDGEICVFTFVEAHLIVDVSGAWTGDGPNRFRTIDPVRVDDSRDRGGRAPGGLTPRRIDLSSHVPPGTTAIVANLTVTRPVDGGFLVIFPCDESPPLASNLNFVPGEDRAVGVVVGIDASRSVCTASNTAHHVILDLAGYYAPTPQFGPSPELRPDGGHRLIDSRDGTGGWTRRLADGETRSFDIRSRLPEGLRATGVLVNLTVTGHTAGGYASVTGCDAPTSETSSVNYDAGVDASNLVLVDLGSSPDLCIFSLRGTHVVLDLFGVVRAGSADTLAEYIELDGHTWPPYRPDASDYVTECGSTLRLDLDLLPRATARVNGLAVTDTPVEVTVDGPGDLVRLDLGRDGTNQRHYFRCVPADFPRAVVTTDDDPDPGWYLLNFPSTVGGRGFAVILDEHGAPVWYQETPTSLALFERSTSGNLLGLPMRHFGLSADPDRGAVETRLDGTLVDEHVTVDAPGIGPGDPDENPTDHHDIVELPSGGIALVSYPLVADVDLTALGAGFGPAETIDDNLIQELDADGDLVWQWRASDHFAFEPGSGATTLVYTHDEIPFPVRWSTNQGHPGVEDVDVFHINSVDLVDDGTDDYVVSARHLDAVFRIDRSKNGDVAWILRSTDLTAPPKSGADVVLDIVGDPLGGPRRMHDARLVGDLLTILDNRVGTGQTTRAVTYQIDADPAGGGTATFVSAITEPEGRTSFGLGSYRPGPDGQVVVNWGSPLQPLFQQLDGDVETMRVVLPSGGNTYRVVWYPKSAFSTSILRATSGRVMQIPD